jgi:hypothetical protein
MSEILQNGHSVTPIYIFVVSCSLFIYLFIVTKIYTIFAKQKRCQITLFVLNNYERTVKCMYPITLRIPLYFSSDSTENSVFVRNSRPVRPLSARRRRLPWRRPPPTRCQDT